jgi:hypothetical protein
MSEANKIFDAAIEFGDRVQRRIDVLKMQEQLGKLRTTCGSCQFWMCSDDCPREWCERGRKQPAPSCDSKACEKFKIKNWDAQLEKKLTDEISKLKEQGI